MTRFVERLLGREKVGRPCPVCGYDLTGLPPVHRCPECGLDYDPHSQVIPLRAEVRSRLDSLAEFAVLLVLLAGFLAISIRYYNRLRRVDPVFGGMLTGGLFLSMMTRFIFSRLRRVPGSHLLIINHRGIEFRYEPPRVRIIPWEQFKEARGSWVTGLLTIKGIDGKKLYANGDLHSARSCAKLLNTLARVYAADAFRSIPPAPADNTDES